MAVRSALRVPPGEVAESSVVEGKNLLRKVVRLVQCDARIMGFDLPANASV